MVTPPPPPQWRTNFPVMEVIEGDKECNEEEQSDQEEGQANCQMVVVIKTLQEVENVSAKLPHTQLIIALFTDGIKKS